MLTWTILVGPVLLLHRMNKVKSISLAGILFPHIFIYSPRCHMHTRVRLTLLATSTIDHIICPHHLLSQFQSATSLLDHPLNTSDRHPVIAVLYHTLPVPHESPTPLPLSLTNSQLHGIVFLKKTFISCISRP